MARVGSWGKVSLVELRERQATWNGFGNGLSQAVEMVVTPLLFALLGWFLDTRFGTGPILAIVLGSIGVIGMAARTYYWYRAEIEREEKGKPWTRSHR